MGTNLEYFSDWISTHESSTADRSVAAVSEPLAGDSQDKDMKQEMALANNLRYEDVHTADPAAIEAVASLDIQKSESMKRELVVVEVAGRKYEAVGKLLDGSMRKLMVASIRQWRKVAEVAGRKYAAVEEKENHGTDASALCETAMVFFEENVTAMEKHSAPAVVIQVPAAAEVVDLMEDTVPKPAGVGELGVGAVEVGFVDVGSPPVILFEAVAVIEELSMEKADHGKVADVVMVEDQLKVEAKQKIAHTENAMPEEEDAAGRLDVKEEMKKEALEKLGGGTTMQIRDETDFEQHLSAKGQLESALVQDSFEVVIHSSPARRVTFEAHKRESDEEVTRQRNEMKGLPTPVNKEGDTWDSGEDFFYPEKNLCGAAAAARSELTVEAAHDASAGPEAAEKNAKQWESIVTANETYNGLEWDMNTGRLQCIEGVQGGYLPGTSSRPTRMQQGPKLQSVGPRWCHDRVGEHHVMRAGRRMANTISIPDRNSAEAMALSVRQMGALLPAPPDRMNPPQRPYNKAAFGGAMSVRNLEILTLQSAVADLQRRLSSACVQATPQAAPSAPEAPLPPPPVDALPPGSKTGKEYYYNKELNVSQWTRPVDPRPVQEEGALDAARGRNDAVVEIEEDLQKQESRGSGWVKADRGDKVRANVSAARAGEYDHRGYHQVDGDQFKGHRPSALVRSVADLQVKCFHGSLIPFHALATRIAQSETVCLANLPCCLKFLLKFVLYNCEITGSASANPFASDCEGLEGQKGSVSKVTKRDTLILTPVSTG